MTFCRNCGQQLSDDAVFCAACGTPVNTDQKAQPEQPQAQPEQPQAQPEQPQAQPEQAQQEQQTQQTQAQQPYQQQYRQQYQQRPAAPAYPVTPTEKGEKGFALLSYLGILLLVPLLVKDKSEYCMFHVYEGAKLCACATVYSIFTSIILTIVGAIFPPHLKYTYYSSYLEPSIPHIILSVIFGIGSVFFIVLAILGIISAVKGYKKPLPLLDQINLRH